MIIINAKLKIKEDVRNDYLDLMNKLVQSSRQEPVIHFMLIMKM